MPLETECSIVNDDWRIQESAAAHFETEKRVKERLFFMRPADVIAEATSNISISENVRCTNKRKRKECNSLIKTTENTIKAILQRPIKPFLCFLL